MEPQIIILLLLESAVVIVLVVIVLLKSRTLSHITSEFIKIKKEETELQRKQAMQDDYIPMLVHDLRSPLSVINGASDLMLKEAQNLTSDQIHMLLSQIQTSSSWMLRLVNDILDVSKLDAGRFEVNKVFGKITDVLSEQASYYTPMAKTKGITLETSLEDKIPNCSFDPDRIKQVMNNLISNAIKYTPDGGKITISAARQNAYVKICVADTGAGIPRQERDKLFHKFVQAKNHTTVKEKGSGLGLVISKGIVHAHGGDIWIEDNLPKGTKFVFTLPLV